MVIKVSSIAHLTVGFLTLGLLIPVMLWPPSAPLLLLPVLLSALIVRLQTVADDRGVTVRTLLDSRTVRWEDIDGLRFHRGSWARARLKSGDELRLPAVTFATLPALTRGQRRPGAQPVPVKPVKTPLSRSDSRR
ncbi:low molecular weight protein antigen 6 [Mycobacterium lepraemurium]|nr:low molecular weight protein antigen 6 [Mycobacterium lepraemurium]